MRDAIEDIRARARALYSRRHYEACIDLLIEALELCPDDAAIHASLGAVYHARGRLREALEALRRAVELDRTCAFAHDNLAVVLGATGRIADALVYHRQAVELDPESAHAHVNYGLALEAAGNRESAETEFRLAIALDDGLAKAHGALGRSHFEREDWEAAEASFHRALDLDPGLVTALTGLARVLSRAGRHAEAMRRARAATRLVPADLRASLCLAEVLAAAHRGYDALDIYRRLERAGTAGPAIDMAKASLLCNLGRYHAALRLFRRVLRVQPHSPARGAYLFALHASALSSDRATLRDLRRWERFQGAPPERVRRFHRRDPDPDRRLRIGYISPDFRQHVVRQFFEPVMLVHDADRFEFYCYSEVRREDHATAELRAVADRWYVTHGRSDAEVAARIDRDRIDVLVDLAGHTANNRLGVLSHRPAPIQATYLGYFGSTGLSAVDYWITDDVLHPPDTGEPATETIHRLPRCAFCYGAPASATVGLSAARESSQALVFGCFNNAAKVNFEVIDTWARILRRVEGSRLVLKDRGFAWGRTRSVWRRRFVRRGIDPARIELQPASPHGAYLDSYRHIDIALDPFPRTGGTTTCDALWMGVPVITLAGRRYVERLSATKLAAVGVGELCATSVDQYIDLAAALAADRQRLAGYHRTLRARMARSPLCDPVSLARVLEDAYRQFWHEYLRAQCAGT